MIPTLTLRSINHRSVKRPSTHLQLLSVLSLSLMSSFFLSSARGVEIKAQILYSLPSEHPESQLGKGMTTLGDLGGDGYEDLAALEGPWSNPANLERLRTISGRDGSVLYTLEFPNSVFGWDFNHRNLTEIGDLNGDGASDFVVTFIVREGDDIGGNHVSIHSGADGSVIRHHSEDETSRSRQLGLKIALLRVFRTGDIDGDQIPDYGTSEELFQDDLGLGAFGYTWLYSGGNGSLIARIELDFPRRRVAKFTKVIGDVDLDGIPDVAILGYDRDAHIWNMTVVSGRARGQTILQQTSDPLVLYD